MPIAPSTISALPTPPTTNSPTDFDQRADTFLAAFSTLRTEINTVSTQNYSNVLEALTSTVTALAAASTATTQAAAAANSALTAQNYAGAPLWVSGTTYTAGQVVYSPVTTYSYRRKTGGAGTTDPSSDTTNWALTNPTGPTLVTVSTATYSAAANGHYVLTGTVQQTVTAPLTPSVGEYFVISIASGRTDTVINRGGNRIMGLLEDMTVPLRNVSFMLRYTGTTTGWWIV